MKNVEKSIPSSIPSRNNTKKCSKKREAVTYGGSEDEGLDNRENGKKFCRYHGTCGHITDECTTVLRF